MQAGLGGPLQGVSGVSACLQELSSQGERIQLMDQSNQSQSHGQSQPSHQHGVDDFLETIFNMSNWGEVGGKVNPWEYNSHNSMSMGFGENINPRLLMSLTPAGMGLGGSQGTSYSSSVAGDNLHMPSAYQDSILGSRQQQLSENLMGRVGPSECPASMVLQLGRTGNASPPGLGTIGVGGSSRSMSAALLAATARSPSSAGSSGSDGSAASTIQSPSAHSWRPPSYGGGIGVGVHSQLPLSLGQGRLDPFTNEADLRGKRLRDEETTRPANTGMLTNFGSGQGIRPMNQHALIRRNFGGAAQLQVPAPSGIATTPAPTLTPTTATGTMPARPRLRAKRGQATDPHSIAERQRRERITERMKALQDLVPSCSKTDRAAKLDEILEYVKFLQLQVKVLSMSRLGGAAAVAPLIVTDTSSEGPAALGRNNDSQISSSDESLVMMERQVAKLMEEDMGSAMQYLQGKRLCVMPLSLAAEISSPSQPSILSSAAASIPAANRTSTPPDRDESHNSKSMGAEAGTSTGGSGTTDNPNGFNSAVKGGESRGGVSHQ